MVGSECGLKLRCHDQKDLCIRSRKLLVATRLELLEHLAARERNVSELVELTRLDQSLVSKHLSLLMRADLLEARSSGARRFYRVHPAIDAGGTGDGSMQVELSGGCGWRVEVVFWKTRRNDEPDVS